MLQFLMRNFATGVDFLASANQVMSHPLSTHFRVNFPTLSIGTKRRFKNSESESQGSQGLQLFHQPPPAPISSPAFLLLLLLLLLLTPLQRADCIAEVLCSAFPPPDCSVGEFLVRAPVQNTATFFVQCARLVIQP